MVCSSSSNMLLFSQFHMPHSHHVRHAYNWRYFIISEILGQVLQPSWYHCPRTAFIQPPSMTTSSYRGMWKMGQVWKICSLLIPLGRGRITDPSATPWLLRPKELPAALQRQIGPPRSYPSSGTVWWGSGTRTPSFFKTTGDICCEEHVCILWDGIAVYSPGCKDTFLLLQSWCSKTSPGSAIDLPLHKQTDSQSGRGT